MAQPQELAPAYLIAGDDRAKIDAALARLRSRAEREGGPGSLESFSGDAGADPQALLAAIPALSLTATRRYLLADGVERWSAAQAKPVIAALGALPPDLTVVLVARESPPKVRAPKGMAEAVAAAGGDVRTYEAPKKRALPSHLMAEAARRGFTLDADAAEMLIARMGDSTTRLATELDRLALWAGEGGEVTADDLEAMVADTSEEVVWALSDALVDRDAAGAALAAARLRAQGEAITPLVYQAAKRLREARMAVDGLEQGRSPKELESALPMHPYAAKMLLRRVRNADAASLRAGTCAVADLEWWTRGGSDYPEDVALTIAIARATGSRRA